MSFDAKKFMTDYSIPWTTKGKHARPGWIQVKCPLCAGNPGFHGGIHLEKGYYNCWRCGSHWLPKIIAILLRIPIPKAKDILKPYLSGDQIREFKEYKYVDKIEFPSGTRPMINSHKRYLLKRRFNPRKLITDWGLMSTGEFGKYANRIFAPIILNGQIVTYQCRSVDDNGPKYMACEDNKQVYHIKYTLYGIDQCHGDKCVAVEGITDVWRLGFGAVGTFGIDYSLNQILMLSQRFKKVFIFYDNEEQAQEKAEQMNFDLGHFGLKCEVIINEDGDPGDLDQQEADKLMIDLIGR